jgi:hypothetical protein
MWGPASAGWEPPPRAFPLPLPPSSFSQTHYFQGTPQFADENGFARMAGKDKIREKGGNRSIPLYLRVASGKVRTKPSIVNRPLPTGRNVRSLHRIRS